MAQFLDTSAITFYLNELIKNAHERLILISPYLKLNDRVREILEDKDRFRLEIKMIYGKNELQPDENNWLKGLSSIRAFFCKNLHAKCYLNEEWAIISSMNLYEFSQVNNNEMGVLITKESDPEAYDDAYKEALRLVRISDELQVTVEKVTPPPVIVPPTDEKVEMLSTSKLAKHLKCSTKTMFTRLLELGYVSRESDSWKLTSSGQAAGGVPKTSPRFGDYIVWPANLLEPPAPPRT